MTIDLVLKYMKDPDREYDAAEIGWYLKIPEKVVMGHLRSLWRGDILTRRKLYKSREIGLQDEAGAVTDRVWRAKANSSHASFRLVI